MIIAGVAMAARAPETTRRNGTRALVVDMWIT